MRRRVHRSGVQQARSSNNRHGNRQRPPRSRKATGERGWPLRPLIAAPRWSASDGRFPVDVLPSRTEQCRGRPWPPAGGSPPGQRGRAVLLYGLDRLPVLELEEGAVEKVEDLGRPEPLAPYGGETGQFPQGLRCGARGRAEMAGEFSRADVLPPRLPTAEGPSGRSTSRRPASSLGHDGPTTTGWRP